MPSMAPHRRLLASLFGFVAVALVPLLPGTAHGRERPPTTAPALPVLKVLLWQHPPGLGVRMLEYSEDVPAEKQADGSDGYEIVVHREKDLRVSIYYRSTSANTIDIRLRSDIPVQFVFARQGTLLDLDHKKTLDSTKPILPGGYHLQATQTPATTKPSR